MCVDSISLCFVVDFGSFVICLSTSSFHHTYLLFELDYPSLSLISIFSVLLLSFFMSIPHSFCIKSPCSCLIYNCEFLSDYLEKFIKFKPSPMWYVLMVTLF
ncbi:hypothetical protein BDP27DRAFT_1340880 [Rhodocollybia butyracea]|uniref:Uncharacterized protein n=1 Tax=Rhodocollybia butyracea TaxID=206335 RepID=A0A9P5PBI3_9AGAR|nr:hypothetical protein BDP27DRAFT_1340880 [Rhodocollybia butyracea]